MIDTRLPRAAMQLAKARRSRPESPQPDGGRALISHLPAPERMVRAWLLA